MVKDNLTVLDFSKKDSIGPIKIIYSDNSEEILKTSSFGDSVDINDFIIFTSDNDENEILCIINKNCIKKIEFIE